MIGPYPDILFHFTTSKGLRGVLTEKRFRLSYSRERIENLGREKRFAVPIVSFCDLRLSELPFHMRKYGKFGIGLSKAWAQKSGLNPVAYANQGSDFTSSLMRGLEGNYQELDVIQELEQLNRAGRNYMRLLNTLRYVKNYEGTLTRRGKSRHYRFADEREWRYVLPHPSQGVLPFIPHEQIADDERKRFFNEQLLRYQLQYSPTDVKYIIVPAESNIRPILESIKKLDYDLDSRVHLASRIVTARQVESDM
ncbi:MAG: abortive infection system antitoxin AbiGi family protein [Ramlibacter sp.]